MARGQTIDSGTVSQRGMYACKHTVTGKLSKHFILYRLAPEQDLKKKLKLNDLKLSEAIQRTEVSR